MLLKVKDFTRYLNLNKISFYKHKTGFYDEVQGKMVFGTIFEGMDLRINKIVNNQILCTQLYSIDNKKCDMILKFLQGYKNIHIIQFFNDINIFIAQNEFIHLRGRQNNLY